MIQIARLTIPQDSPQGIVREPGAILEEALSLLGLRLEDISLQYKDWKTEFGNFVIVPVLDNQALRKLAEHFGPSRYFDGAPDTRIDCRSAILTAEDLEPLEVGDRVSGIIYDLWGAEPFEGIIVHNYPAGSPRQKKTISLLLPGEHAAVAVKPSRKKGFLLIDGQRAEIHKEIK